MKFNVEKLKQLSRPMTPAEREDIKERNDNRDWLALSSSFALTVRKVLRIECMTQKELASRMGVSSAQVAKILSGKENISLQTIAKIERALGKKLIEFNVQEEVADNLRHMSQQTPQDYLICAEPVVQLRD